MMIDTVRVLIPVDWGRPLYGGQVLVTKFDADGEEVRDYQVLKHANFEGSFSSSLQLRCVDGCNLELYGSCTKWLTGHNLFGGTDLFVLLRRSLDRLANGPLADFARVEDDQIYDAKIQRIDINEMFELNSPADVKLYLSVAAARTSLSYRGKGALAENGCTLSWGMHKGNRSAWKVKFYAKGPESRVVRRGKSSLPGRLLVDGPVMNWVDRQLRLEYEIHGRDLDKLELRQVKDWKPETAETLFTAKTDLFFWGDDPVSIEENRLEIKPRVTAVYDSWKAGRNIRAMTSSATAKRWRSEVKKAYGVDIFLPAPATSNVEILSFKRVLELRVARPDQVRRSIAQLLAA